ncbi:hypothetical protein [Arthrobacter sp. AL12]|uniref:hypothetical protein n=1 Tax=Arthrobacter sp. AL12 TaxID=3042241 RepID=UPI00249B54FC|nr:hypothetical protein [Arthrobacter sp. AL12]MDI3211859.1 hypothetical protein [Arthrobacter sp. AL12]
MGIVGLGLMTATVSANATPPEEKKITICHATSSSTNPFVIETISLNALNGHTGPQHSPLDIIPINDGDIMPQGQNLTAANLAILANVCAAVVDPDPEVAPDPDPDPDPEVAPDPDPEVAPDPDPEVATDPDPQNVTPLADTTPNAVLTPSAPTGAAPKAAVAAAKAAKVAKPAAKKTNAGYNVQTAVGQTSDAGIPVWLMALTGVLTAGAATVLWQGGGRARNTESQ